MRVFVYGTLKRGERNHGRFCRSVQQIEEAAVLGRLYHLPVGYPMLVVPAANVLEVGTTDYLGDEQLQVRRSGELLKAAMAAAAPEGEWEPISGEILTFDDPELLPKLDRLEQFVPGSASFYDRVLICPLPPASGAVWTYVASNGQLPEGAQRIGSRWP